MLIRTTVALCLLCAAARAQEVVVAPNSVIELGPGSQLAVSVGGVEVQNAGTLNILGTSTNRAQFLGPLTGAGQSISVLGGGTLDVKWAKLENLSTLTLSVGSTLKNLRDTQIEDQAGLSPATTPWIDLSALGANDRANLPFSFNLVKFTDPQGTPTRTNIKTGASTPVVTLLGDVTNDGNRWGESSDDDAANRIGWAQNAVKRYVGTTLDTTTPNEFPTIHAALSDTGTTSGKRLKVELGAMVFIDESIDWNDAAYGGRPDSTGPAVELAHMAPMSGLAFSNSGGTSKGVLIRSVIARGGVDRTTAKNVTFFDPRVAGLPAVSNTAATNCLFECDFTGTGNTFTTCFQGAREEYFRNAAGYDLRLANPAGLNAVDEGTAQTYTENTDVDGESFDFDGKAGGATTWDIGADSMVAVTAPTLAVSARTTTSITWAIGTTLNESGFHFYLGAHADTEPAQVTLPADTTTYLENSGITENQFVSRHIHGYTPAGDWGASPDVSGYAAVHDATTGNFALTPGSSSVLVTVAVVPNSTAGLTGVQIERSPDGSTGWTVVQSFASTYVFNDTSLAAQTWYYRITYRNGDGIASLTSGNNNVIVGGTLTAPVITTPSKKSNDNTPVISGTHPTNGATVEVWIGNTSVGTTTVASGTWTIHNTGTTFPDAAYTVQAREKNGTVYSNSSNTITFTVDTTPPDAPTGISLVQLNNKILVQWRASSASDLRGYNVYRGPAAGGPFTKLNGSTPVRKDQTQYLDSTAANGTTYYYKVTAVDDAADEDH